MNKTEIKLNVRFIGWNSMQSFYEILAFFLNDI